MIDNAYYHVKKKSKTNYFVVSVCGGFSGGPAVVGDHGQAAQDHLGHRQQE